MPSPLRSDLDRAACLGLLATRSFGRLIFTRQALPEILPVAYQLDGESVMIRLAGGSAAATATADAIVAFEVDDVDLSSGSGWTVTVVGLAREIVHLDERWQRARPDLSSGAADGRDQVLEINSARISGHRFTAETQRASA